MCRYRTAVLRLPIIFFAILAVACTPVPSGQIPASQPPAIPASPTIPAYRFESGTMSVTPKEIQAGQAAQVTSTVRNTGSRQNAYVGTLYVDGQEYARQAVTLNPGDNGFLTFQLTNLGAGTHLLKLGDSSASLKVFTVDNFQIVNNIVDLPRYTNLQYTFAPPLPHVSAENFSPPVTPFFIRQIDFRFPYPEAFRILDAKGKQLYSADIAHAASAYVPDVPVDADFMIELQTNQPAADIRSGFFGESSYTLVIAYFWPHVSTIEGIQKRY
jgi:hypothetical protein